MVSLEASRSRDWDRYCKTVWPCMITTLEKQSKVENLYRCIHDCVEYPCPAEDQVWLGLHAADTCIAKHRRVVLSVTASKANSNVTDIGALQRQHASAARTLGHLCPTVLIPYPLRWASPKMLQRSLLLASNLFQNDYSHYTGLLVRGLTKLCVAMNNFSSIRNLRQFCFKTSIRTRLPVIRSKLLI